MEAITISLDIIPAKGRQPATVNVGAAAGDGTPFLLTGTFAERHQLVDQAYGQALKQRAKAESRAESKKDKGKAPKGKTRGKPLPGHMSLSKVVTTLEGAVADQAEPEPDQIGPDETHEGTQTPLVEPADDLPVIEGDDGQLELELEGSNGD